MEKRNKKFDNLSGKTFGCIEVLEFSHMKQNGENKRHGMSYYKCRCNKCGKDLILSRSNITQDPHTGCPHHKSLKH